MAGGIGGTYFIILEGATQYYDVFGSTNKQKFEL
jgi:hypothetical protein